MLFPFLSSRNGRMNKVVMDGYRKVPFKCLVAFILAVIVNKCSSLGISGGDMLPLGTSLTGNQTVISRNGTFELGFFNPKGTNIWYFGIWYAKVSYKTIVWVANREAPLLNEPGMLTLGTEGYLTLSDTNSKIIWSSNNTQKAKASMALLLDTGNFLMAGAQNTSETVWESFGYPTDTLLPGMKFWKGMKLTSWKNSVDPAPGPFSLQMDPSAGKTQIRLLYNDYVPYYTTGEWTGDHFSNMPSAAQMSLRNEEFERISLTKMYYTYTLTNMMLARIFLDRNGALTTYWLFDNTSWTLVKSAPQKACDTYGVCGAFGVCMSDAILSCSCVQGFNPTDRRTWNSDNSSSNGCVRLSPLQCSHINGTTDGFLQLGDKSLPQEKAVTYIHEQTQKGCRTSCLNNCSCSAFTFIDSNPAICSLWFGDLLNMRYSSDGRPLFIRLAASELISSSSKEGRKSRVRALSISLGVAAAAFAAVSTFLFVYRKLRNKHREEEDCTPTSLRTFTYRELKVATKNFSDKLGSGAFGTVFKGILPNRTLVAVKKLGSSVQGEKQFRAEISTIGNIQHVNLVRLWGFCAEGSRRLLVYEYMPNGSLNSFLFLNSGGTQKVLDWKTRFQITMGITKGLIYLHDKCRDKIIHCDIKPENIVLDDSFSPKIADFGLAKLVGREFSRVLTTTRGTMGYLAPEWISGLPITPKVDVYSFGMMVLEIISGRRNLDLTVQEPSRYYFPSWAATQIEKGNNIIDIVDEKIVNNIEVEEVRRSLLVSMLCIHNNENLRPSMEQVLLLLEGKTEVDTNGFQRSLRVLVEDNVEDDS